MERSERPDTRAIWEANAAAWIDLARAGYDVSRDLVNTPAFFAALPPIDGRVGLDVGCGEGHNTRRLLDAGARAVALDTSERFLRAASGATPGLPCVLGDGAVLPYRDAQFDFVTGFMSLMDVADPESTLCEIARVLRPGGFVQFSILHPATSTPVHEWIASDDGNRRALAIGDYFYEGPLTETWTFGAQPPEHRDRYRPFTITYARRTLAGWFDAIAGAGLVLEALVEPHASEETAAQHPKVADSRIAPWFLLLRARKPAS